MVIIIIQSCELLITKIFFTLIFFIEVCCFTFCKLINLVKGAEIMLYSTDMNSSVNFGM